VRRQTCTFLHPMPPSYTELSNLEHLFRGDQSQIREWIGLYLQESPAYFDQLTASLESGDAQALASAAHDLQPQAHYLGSVRMLELLATIEEQALNGDTLGCLRFGLGPSEGVEFFGRPVHDGCHAAPIFVAFASPSAPQWASFAPLPGAADY
jgi:HPt (histidine-containing phosphotransfer) domain-containing protein